MAVDEPTGADDGATGVSVEGGSSIADVDGDEGTGEDGLGDANVSLDGGGTTTGALEDGVDGGLAMLEGMPGVAVEEGAG